MKLKHGKESPIKPLPKGESEVIKLNSKNKKEVTLDKYNSIFHQSNLNFKVPEKLSNPHPLVKKAKEVLKNQKAGWYGKGKDIIYSGGKCISTEVTRDNIPRALLIWDTFIKILLLRGHKISEVKDSEFLILGEDFTIRVREILKRVKVQDSRWEHKENIGSGILSIKIHQGYNQREWRDQKSKTIEDLLPSILDKLEQLAQQEKKERRERDEWYRRNEIEQNIKKEKDERVALELQNFKQLFETATRWNKSQYLRNYIKEFEQHSISSNMLDDQKRNWIAWAKEKADWYDPFIEKEVELLMDFDRDTLRHK
ncbi:hypothetical protein [Gillisia sp. CAL575]|uniref:hypothetical protein n=1 Tax=Gillisia sp. CAL575 TaxID=985255 RepID=UPI0003A409DC|nr:hypothetical protein [Gillisia sp. CAL575]